ncbi:MAG: hypothetical protein Q4A21_03125, partial [bacterium]|nr:hypothetical protein [bacterium]
MAKKYAKFGIALASVALLGAAQILPATVPFIGATVVKAEVSGKAILTGAQGVNSDGTITYFNEYSSEFWITSENPYIVKAPDIDGWELEGIYLRFNDQTERKLSNNSTVSVEDFNGKPTSSYDGGVIYQYASPAPADPKPAPQDPAPADP